ncbi:MAG: SseB family protein [Planctomycetes bacterium]|nr:SseB family protein [Planctomycetota bacterium]
MTADFDPLNELENALVAAQEGRLPVVSFIDKLLASKVALLLQNDPGPTWDNSTAPLILTNDAGHPVIAVFTALERSLEWTKREPKFTFALLTDFVWVLRGISAGVGLVLNPGLPTGLEMPASGVAQLKVRAQGS